MLRRKKEGAASLRDASRALMTAAATPGADLGPLAERAAELRAELADRRAGGRADADAALLDEADRYLAFVTATADPPALDPLEAAARALDADVLAAAQEVVAGRTVDEDRSAALLRRMDELLARARAEGRLEQVAPVLHDARLDLTYVRSGGAAPTSVRLAHQRPR